MRAGSFSVRFALALSCLLALLAGCDSSTDLAPGEPGVLVRVNGVTQDGFVPVKFTDKGLLLDARAFAAKLPGLVFYNMPTSPSPGICLQYGKKISFACIGKDTGFCSAKKTAMDPPMQLVNGSYWAPLNFFAQSVAGVMELDEAEDIINVIMPLPGEIGDMIPQARALAEKLAGEFFIQQGEICLTNAIELFAAGYAPNCNGNNAGAAYLVVQNPPSPRNPVVNVMPMSPQMDEDEAFVWVGNTPPECKYFSYQHFLMNRFYDDEDPPTRKKLYARLGDAINSYNLPLPDDPFKKFFVFIIAGNQETHDKVLQAALDAGLARNRILSLIIPDRTDPNLDIRFGSDATSDGFNFLHRASVFERDGDKQSYVDNPTLEILRVTPKAAPAKNPLPRPLPRDRQTGVREQDIPGLAGLLDQLQTQILTAHAGNFKYTRLLLTSTWMYPGGDTAIENREDVLGETNDTLYLQSGKFTLHEDDLIVVFGVNHDRTGKSVYSNVSCYGAKYENGVGGIFSTPWSADAPGRPSYFGTAEQYLPGLPAQDREKLYAYKFARRPLDESTFVIPYNDGSFQGHNNGDTVFMGFRIYVDILTTIGAYPGDTEDGNYFPYEGAPNAEVFFDQALLFTNVEPVEP